jgi:hypothetical protein
MGISRDCKGLFWSDSQSRRDYEAFGDVVVFYSTHRTNKYNLPFVPFVGLRSLLWSKLQSTPKDTYVQVIIMTPIYWEHEQISKL